MQVTLREMKHQLRRMIESQNRTGRKKSMLIVGPAGCAKSATVDSIARAYQAHGFGYVCLNPTQTNIFDHVRFEPDGNGQLVEHYSNLIDFDRPIILCLDEFCDIHTHETAFWNRVLYNHEWGGRQLAAGSIVIACGNLPKHSSSANPPAQPAINRMLPVEVVGNLEQWLEDFALPANLSPVVLAFLRFVKQSESVDLIRDGWEKAEPGSTENFVSMRSATNLADHIGNSPWTDADQPAAIAYFGNEYGLKFHAFATLADCDPQTVLANPDACPIPSAIDKRLLLLALLAAVATTQNVGEILKFSNRLDPGYSLGLFEDIARRLPSLKETAHWCRIIKQHPELI